MKKKHTVELIQERQRTLGEKYWVFTSSTLRWRGYWVSQWLFNLIVNILWCAVYSPLFLLFCIERSLNWLAKLLEAMVDAVAEIGGSIFSYRDNPFPLQFVKMNKDDAKAFLIKHFGVKEEEE